ncbi:ABC transporter permease [Aquimarina sp. D1M17]|uniref:ABC transporter permease n=1 Tax=Aquimarina acroporae TaxID=2937283 RepID=UPI0020C146E7|nr:ABC transporter permease [Aquimarina acroporae]MCK8523155.1 ABC transporter permease [Aquimarina acroporae]
MIKNYFKIAWRNLLKHKLFSFINIFGLAVGLATCLLLTLYIMDEVSYDKHHKNADRVHRIFMKSAGTELATTAAPMAQTLQDEFPEIEMATRVLKFPNVDKFLLKNKKEDIKLYETNGYYVDSTFFKVLTYDFKYGVGSTALNRPNMVVLSEDVAFKLFGEKNPVNEVIDIEIPYGVTQYTVGGVFRNDSYKSHINANLLLSMKNNDVGTWVDSQEGLLGNNLFYTYLKFKEGSSVANFERKLPDFTQRHLGAQLAESNFERNYFTQPLEDIYLNSNMQWELAPNGSMTYIYIFSAIAAFLLLIACVNFMNLSTARSEKRAREVGMRKVLGAKKNALVFQFFGESLLLCLLALSIALLLVWTLLPVFNTLIQKQLDLFAHPSILIIIFGLTILTSLLSGLYPALYLSSFTPITVLKGALVNSISAKSIRKGLVVFQFAVSAVLILVSGVIWQQMNFLKNKDLGFKKEQQLLIPLRSVEVAENYATFKTELLKNPNVVSASVGDSYPGLHVISDNGFYAEDKTIHDNVYTRYGQVADDYIETLGYTLLHGRTFSKNRASDSLSIILNKTAVEQIGYNPETAVGRKVFYGNAEEKNYLEIIGVIEDFNFKSLHEPIAPYALLSLGQANPNYFVATLSHNNFATTIKEIQSLWERLNPNIPFEYSFLDENFYGNYAAEQRTSKVVFWFMLIAIFIACIGLFGLASFSTEQRKKEVGIRRVLGASVLGITTLHLKDFLKLVFTAMLVASPLAYYAGNRWLENFAYKIEISWVHFVVATVLAVVIAISTVGFHVVKAALSNPVKSLRTE